MSDAHVQSSEHAPANDGAADTMSTAPEPPPASGDAPARPAEDVVDEEEDEEEDKEPNLKYTRLTSSLASLYRGGDSTSAFAVTGDKMVVGTHNGNIHVLSLPSLQSVRHYHAHSGSITSVSISPFSPVASVTTAGSEPSRLSVPLRTNSGRSPSVASDASTTTTKPPPRTSTIPSTPANSIYIATSSMDGHVCVSSLVDSKDVMLRNYARPVQTVALSPNYKSDRTYLSGGMAGQLILTVGGRTGVSTDANTNSAAASASGWLGAIGLGGNTGSDKVLHSGEGNISTIKWSSSGKYVMWTNEEGTKIMRSSIGLESTQMELAWKRIAHVPRPNRRIWEDMSGVWKAHAQWVDDRYMEDAVEDSIPASANNGFSDTASIAPSIRRPAADTASIAPSTRRGGPAAGPGSSRRPAIPAPKTKRIERLVCGWGDTVWMVHVHPGRSGEVATAGKAEIVHQITFPDGIISGVTLYTPTLLLALVYRTRDDNDNPINTAEEAPKKGRQRRQNGLPPDLRLIDLKSPNKDEVEVEGLTVSRFETLAAGDYHMSTIFVPKIRTQQNESKGALEVIGGIGGGIWDASINASVNATRLFSSGASVLSATSSGDRTSAAGSGVTATAPPRPAPVSAATGPIGKPGLKILIHSPYDCVLAIKRDLADRLNWLIEHEHYEGAYDLIEAHPEIITPAKAPSDSQNGSPSKNNGSLADFFADDASSDTASVSSRSRAHNSAISKEKRRIGDLWIQQLVSKGDWAVAGAIAGRVLDSSSGWERWIWQFAQANKFDDITPYIPTEPMRPPLPSMVYELVLGNYISQDRVRLKELLDAWSPSLFDISSVTAAIESKLNTGDVRENTVEDGIKGRDWHVLQDCLAKLYLADGRPAEALQCYIRTQSPDAALDLVRDYQLLAALADSVYAFVTIRLSQQQIAEASLEDLESLSQEPTQMLVSAAIQGIISQVAVVNQLQSRGPVGRPFLYFYLSALWRGESHEALDQHFAPAQARTTLRRSRFDPEAAPDSTTKALMAPFGDLAVSLFAEYGRTLLAQYLRTSQDYSFEHASRVCEQYHYIPELVHLLSATGQTKRALHLIIDELDDVKEAINFAKEVDDDGLWEDLLDFSMHDPGKPKFISGLLDHAGTTINPVDLVKRIPASLEIPGLKHSLGRLVKESEVMWSISEGAATVLRSEVLGSMKTLREHHMKGVVFDVPESLTPEEQLLGSTIGLCSVCKTPYTTSPAGSDEDNLDHLLGFPCGHIFHLSCLLDAIVDESNEDRVEALQRQLEATETDEESSFNVGKVGNKITHAQMIKGIWGNRGCPVCEVKKITDEARPE